MRIIDISINSQHHNTKNQDAEIQRKNTKEEKNSKKIQEKISKNIPNFPVTF